MDSPWKFRSNNEKGSYEARLRSHAPNTSVEYGEKTWTTAQTVRDLMQNHLDAETEKYFKQIAQQFVGVETLKALKQKELDVTVAKQLHQFLHGVFIYSKHAADMSPRARILSLEYLQKKASTIPLLPEVTEETFTHEAFLNRVGGIEEELPKISFHIFDRQTNTSVGWVPYETLKDEPMYRERHGTDYRYSIYEIKIADHGSGYDSQLASFFVSTKTEKQHTRGKFGEGAKMSELHLLRANAKIKMRSEYSARNKQGEEQHRTWQLRARANDANRLVTHGVEIARAGTSETGSSITVSLGEAKPTFSQEFISNIDPRVGGLGKNIAYFNENTFTYTNPVSDAPATGVDIHGDEHIQYVQGIRVELASEVFGYSRPWFSYDFQDSSIIAGRDRNEIKSSVQDKIRSFWINNDNLELIDELVRVLIQDKRKSRGSIEERFMDDVMGSKDWSFHEFDDTSEFKTTRLPKIVEAADQALIRYLGLEPGIRTVVIPPNFEEYKDHWTLQKYFDEENIVQIRTERDIGAAVEGFQKRHATTHQILTPYDIRKELQKQREKETVKKEFIEGEKELQLRAIFADAVESVDAFVEALGVQILKKPAVEFINPNEKRYHRSGDDGIEVWHNGAQIDSRWIDISTEEKAQRMRKKIELKLLSRYGDGSEQMKASQRFLDDQIARLLTSLTPLVAQIPDTFPHVKDVNVARRIVEQLTAELDKSKNEVRKGEYDVYMRAVAGKLTLQETQELCAQDGSRRLGYSVSKRLREQFFVEGGTFSFNDGGDKWRSVTLSPRITVGKWNNLPVYKVAEDAVFIPAILKPGAVITRGEGKLREYFFNEGEHILAIGTDDVAYSNIGYLQKMRIQPQGIFLDLDTWRDYDESLKELTYYPRGVANNDRKAFTPGTEVTAIPLEYGKDEWDNPVRVFQDLIQNHIDASPSGERVILRYEVQRGDDVLWLQEKEILVDDTITGVAFTDSGEGYTPSDIATLGASSKKSPLFAGKYGEGQKMVAAAALRNGIDLQYESRYLDDSGNFQSWRAQAQPYTRQITLDGEEVDRDFVSFAIENKEMAQTPTGSRTVLKLSREATQKERELWSEWLTVIDPRHTDNSNNKGLARYVRQLRPKGSEDTFSVGSITLLFNEPGAVYENGLRINSDAEKGRDMAFGYDVPEIVTTRERNSYNSDRLHSYITHLLKHTKDPKVIKKVLEKFIVGGSNSDLALPGFSDGSSTAGYWAEIAQALWPNKLVYSSQKIRRDLERSEMFFDREDEIRTRELRHKTLKIQANLVHFDKENLINVPLKSYSSLSSILPSVESAIDKLEHQTVPISMETRESLTRAVVDATNIFKELYSRTKDILDHPMQRGDIEDRLKKWSDFNALIETDTAVGLAPIDAGFHGLASNGVVLNEQLCFLKDKRVMAEVILHEMNHLLTQSYDYSEDFVETMYDLAKYLLELRGGRIAKSEERVVRAWEFETDETDESDSDSLSDWYSDDEDGN